MRLSPADRLLLGTLLVIWAAGFALHLDALRAGTLHWTGVYVTAATNAPPTVRSFWKGMPASTSGLAVGDRLLHAGGIDLRGVGPMGFYARALEAAGPSGRLTLQTERAGHPQSVELRLDPIPSGLGYALVSAGFALAAIVILLRAAPSTRVRPLVLGLGVLAVSYLFFQGGPAWKTLAWIAVFSISTTLSFPLLIRAAQVFPGFTPPLPLASRGWPWLFASMGPALTSLYFGVPFAPDTGLLIAAPGLAAFGVAILVVLRSNFRRADPVGRRRIHWLLFGFFVAAAPAAVASLLLLLAPQLWWLVSVSHVAELAIPVCTLIALVRFDLLDIERLIAATLAGSGPALLGGLFVAVVARGPAESLATSTGLDPGASRLLAAGSVAVLLAPAVWWLSGWLRPRIEARLFPSRVELASGFGSLETQLAGASDPERAAELACHGLDGLLRPEHYVLYARVNDAGFEARFARGVTEPPALSARGALLSVLRDLRRPLAVSTAAGSGAASPDAFQGAALETLGAEVIAPIRTTGELRGFFCLGPKRSGDVYTPTDLAHLADVAAALFVDAPEQSP